MNRRNFLKAGLASSALAACAGAMPHTAAVTKAQRDPYRSLKIGLTSYTLRKFKLEQALQMARETGVKYISLKEVHLPLKSTAEERRAVAQKVKDAGLILMGGGVI